MLSVAVAVAALQRIGGAVLAIATVDALGMQRKFAGIGAPRRGKDQGDRNWSEGPCGCGGRPRNSRLAFAAPFAASRRCVVSRSANGVAAIDDHFLAVDVAWGDQDKED